ncbi:MAG: hypothetical protein RL062_802 [Bacteroidota bacterium]|jgi:hypothetical protein
MKKLFASLFILVVLAAGASAQCRAFTKNRVLPNLTGFIQNENYNAALFMEGDEAELLMTFYGGKDYRLVVMAHPVLPEVEFEVLDTNDELLYSNKTATNKNTFDFRMTSTQQLKVRVKVPDSKGTMVRQGCVTVVAGHKQS